MADEEKKISGREERMRKSAPAPAPEITKQVIDDLEKQGLSNFATRTSEINDRIKKSSPIIVHGYVLLSLGSQEYIEKYRNQIYKKITEKGTDKGMIPMYIPEIDKMMDIYYQKKELYKDI